MAEAKAIYLAQTRANSNDSIHRMSVGLLVNLLNITSAKLNDIGPASFGVMMAIYHTSKAYLSQTICQAGEGSSNQGE